MTRIITPEFSIQGQAKILKRTGISYNNNWFAGGRGVDIPNKIAYFTLTEHSPGLPYPTTFVVWLDRNEVSEDPRDIVPENLEHLDVLLIAPARITASNYIDKLISEQIKWNRSSVDVVLDQGSQVKAPYLLAHVEPSPVFVMNLSTKAEAAEFLENQEKKVSVQFVRTVKAETTNAGVTSDVLF